MLKGIQLLMFFLSFCFQTSQMRISLKALPINYCNCFNFSPQLDHWSDSPVSVAVTPTYELCGTLAVVSWLWTCRYLITKKITSVVTRLVTSVGTRLVTSVVTSIVNNITPTEVTTKVTLVSQVVQVLVQLQVLSQVQLTI